MKQMTFKRVCLTVAVCTALVVSAHAARLIRIGGIPIELPGIDRLGNVDFGNPGRGTARLIFNSRNGNFVARANGRVPNQSRRRQVFRNQIAPTVAGMFPGVDPNDVRVRRDIYIVARRGRARAVLAGKFLGDLGDLL